MAGKQKPSDGVDKESLILSGFAGSFEATFRSCDLGEILRLFQHVDMGVDIVHELVAENVCLCRLGSICFVFAKDRTRHQEEGGLIEYYDLTIGEVYRSLDAAWRAEENMLP